MNFSIVSCYFLWR